MNNGRHRRSWNEKRCARNAKISGVILEQNTQHDKINENNAMLCDWLRKQAGKIPVRIVIGRGTHSFGWSTARLATGRTTRVQTCHLNVRTSEPHACPDGSH
jgi:hypothetical protein